MHTKNGALPVTTLVIFSGDKMALKEVAIAAHNSRSGNTLEGDIIVVRKPLGYVGKKEQRSVIWVLMDDSDLPDPSRLRGDSRLGETFKHRFNIALADLTGLDLTRARDTRDAYQPFVTVNRRDGTLSNQQSRRVSYVERS